MRKIRRLGGQLLTGHDSGIALIIVLMVMLVLTLLSAALVFTARSETIASKNYALETQADYVAKSGIENAINWFRSTHYTAVSENLAGTDYPVAHDAPGTCSNNTAPFCLYTSNSNPVLCIANCSSNSSRVQLIGVSIKATPPLRGSESGGRPHSYEFFLAWSNGSSKMRRLSILLMSSGENNHLV